MSGLQTRPLTCGYAELDGWLELAKLLGQPRRPAQRCQRLLHVPHQLRNRLKIGMLVLPGPGWERTIGRWDTWGPGWLEWSN